MLLTVCGSIAADKRERPDRRGQIKCTALICSEAEVSAQASPLHCTTAAHSRTYRGNNSTRVAPQRLPKVRRTTSKIHLPPFPLSLSLSLTIYLLCTYLFKPHAASRGILAPDPSRCLGGISRTHYAVIGQPTERRADPP